METTQELPPLTLEISSETAIERLFEEQQAYHPFVRRTTAPERIRKLERLRDKVMERRQDIHAALYADFRKPALEVDITEIAPLKFEIGHVTKALAGWMEPQQVRMPMTLVGTKSEVRYEPKGVALIISPWNYPVSLSLMPLVSAVAAGCCAIIKPSEYTPHASRVIKEIVGEVFDAREVAVVEGEVDVAKALLRQPFDHVFFTGSPGVGKEVMKAAAAHLASVTLELGGKSPTIVDETANLDAAAARIVSGKFVNSGQTCIAPDYLYVHERVQDALVEKLRARIRDFYGEFDAARAASADYARIVNEKHYARVKRLLDDALSAGAKLTAGGMTDAAHRYISPTLLTEVPMEAQVMEEEIFGPLLPILPFRSLDEAIATINSKPKPLALYLFSSSEANIEKVLRETSAGGCCINDTAIHFLHPELPFGGVNNSGIGKSHGHHGFLAFSNEKSVLYQRLPRSPLAKFYPPYTGTTQKLIDLMLKYL